MCTTPIFQFNQLNTLSLSGLLRLKGFYAGNYTLVCPSLRNIDVAYCEKLSLFKTLSKDNPERFRDDKLPVLVQQPLFIDEEVIPNLERLRLDRRNANVILQSQHLDALYTKLTRVGLYGYGNEEDIFPYWFLQNAHALEWLFVEWSSFKKIFQDVSEKVYTRLKSLILSGLPKLEDICEEGSQVHPIIEFLEYLKINECHSLTNLLPSSGTFGYLIYLGITNCNGLINLITSPTAQSLSKLVEMEVENCNSLEEIITGKEDVDIEFTSLEVLKLECLPRLNKFCSNNCSLKFPLLEEVFVRECPRLKIFSEGYTSTLNLRKVKVAENDEEWLWKGSLNDTIKNMFDDKVAFHKLKHLTLAEYPELKDLWYSQLKGNIFCNLKSLVLEVSNCGSLETVFDVKDFQEPRLVGEIHDMPQALFSIEKISPNLEDLALNGKDALRILNGLQVRNSSFDTLFLTETEGISHLTAQYSPMKIRKLLLYELEQLKYIWQEGFPLDHLVSDEEKTEEDIILDVLNIDEEKAEKDIILDVVKSDKEKAEEDIILDVVKSDEEKAKEYIIFEKLEYLEFTSLSRCRSFCYGSYTFLFPNLVGFVVKGCPQMKIFSSGVIIAPLLTAIEVEDQKKRWKDDVNATMEQLFIEQVEHLIYGICEAMDTEQDHILSNMHI
ncbi:Leucine-rich repeat domain superfamily [Sesbania bispinosa]|nr:Leucine-rich repeat domain superfamily [Sesbania bispinosa]